MTILPHEYLHAISFPKDSDVDLWIAPKSLMAFVHCVSPVSKWRFIYLSLLPNLLFGFLPFLLWLILPLEYTVISELLFSFSALNLTLGMGDYLNVYNTITQVPNNAMTQLSGFHSYWYEIE